MFEKMYYTHIKIQMQKQTQKAIVIQSIQSIPVYSDFEIPQPGQNQLLIKVIATTINNYDKLSAKGYFGPVKVPSVAGLEGFGEIIKAGSPQHEKLVGRKVSFLTLRGTWAEYTVAPVFNVWFVDSDVPIESAASGAANPLTAISIVDTFQKWSLYGQTGKGIINTAAASSLGKMLVKYTQKLGIPLLNIVRRKEQVKILQELGAKFIVDTSEPNWVDQYKELINTHGFNVLFDAIAGGDVTDSLISNLKPGSQVYLYAKLSPDPFILKRASGGLRGTSITDFTFFNWLQGVTPQERQKIQDQYSSLLKKELSTTSVKQIGLKDVPSIWDEVEKRSTEGKFTIKI